MSDWLGKLRTAVEEQSGNWEGANKGERIRFLSLAESKRILALIDCVEALEIMHNALMRHIEAESMGKIDNRETTLLIRSLAMCSLEALAKLEEP